MTETRIMLASGALFDILEPHGSPFTIGDIAHGLARVCRFAGHTTGFYSVAEHSIHVARIVPDSLYRAAILHDATEAFIGDVTRPLKSLLPDYRAIEDNIADAIAQRFLGTDGSIFRAPEIKAADAAMCMAEARYFMPAAPRDAADYWSIANLSDPIMANAWEQARKVYFQCGDFAKTATAFVNAYNRAGHRAAERMAA